MHFGICEYCGKKKEYKYKSLVKRYCSHDCSNKASADARKKERVILICKNCGTEFKLLDSVIRSRRNQGHAVEYCSKECAGLYMRTRKIVKCKNCGKEFETTRNKYCCVDCVREYRINSGMMKKNGYWLENGYKVLYLEGNNSIKEHIKIMEEFIGRKLKEDEVVHHINEDRVDNRIENLKLMTRGEHSRLHREKELQEGKEFFTASIQDKEEAL